MKLRRATALGLGLRLLALLALLAPAACGGRPAVPPRGIGETSIDGWELRRYQHVLDVEVWVRDNPGEGFAGSYVRGRAERAGRLADDDVVNVLVTRYARRDGVLRATVTFLRRLAQEAGYSAEEDRVRGVRLVTLAGHDERWVMWPAGAHVVKLGGRGRAGVPDALIAWYGARYPSTLPPGALEGRLPPGPAEPPPPDAPSDPDAPSPDWRGYDPARPLPERGDGSASFRR